VQFCRLELPMRLGLHVKPSVRRGQGRATVWRRYNVVMAIAGRCSAAQYIA
jgi:hypothetical protein